MATPVHILALLAVLVSYSPLRSCIVQEWAFGSSCHDGGEVVLVAQQPVAVEGVPHGCVPHGDGEHAESCACERPKVSAAERTLGADLTPDLLAPLTAPLLHLKPLVVGHPHDNPFHPPTFPSLARSLPLLI